MARKGRHNYNRRAHFTFFWKIFSSNKDTWCFSPEFTIQTMQMTKWCVNLTFYEDCTPASGTIKRMHDDGPDSIQIVFELVYFVGNESSTIRSSAHFQKNCTSKDYEFSEMVAGACGCSPIDFTAVRCRIWRKGTEISKSELCFASTQFDTYQRQYVWAVKQFSLVLQGEKRTRVLNGNIKECPQLILSLSLTQINDKEFVCLQLEAPVVTYILRIKARISLLDDEGMVFLGRPEEEVTIWQYEQIKKLAIFTESDVKCNNSLSDDILVFQCELEISTGIPVRSGIDDYRLMDYSDDSKVFQKEGASQSHELNETTVSPFKENDGKLMEDGALSDVCLRTGTKSFPVHKFILSSRSPAFRRMFTSDMDGKAGNQCIDVPDLDADTLEHLLLYIYRDEVQELTWESAADLLKAADKFELAALKEKCYCIIKSNLSKSNICEILIFADQYHDEGLLNSAQEFIRDNSEIIRSDVWKVFKQNHSKLALETTEQIICNMK